MDHETAVFILVALFCVLGALGNVAR